MCRSGEECFHKYDNIVKEFKIVDAMMDLSGAPDWFLASNEKKIELIVSIVSQSTLLTRQGM